MSDWNALLIHGAGGGAWEWGRWRGVLEAHAIAVRTVELQPAPQGLGATALRDYAMQVELALRVLQRPRVLVGASLGGLLAAMCADEADALVLVNPLPPAPWHRRLVQRPWDRMVPWRRNARLHSTREAMPDADDASALWAFRHWRDESGQALREAHAGVEVEKPDCPALFVVSERDEDVPAEVIADWAQTWRADRLETIASSHVGPLLGRQAQAIAVQAVAWLNRLGRAG
ncbi:alpha/beta hydrolase [Pseudoxanthomonas sacheonensis]|uniref:Pimeloyl-ACP methyl ester carboxylesterase n=1 Tax=Pseudoxanthomonas sacheonensis TaxID=443615 RepID=A0ABU1RQ03_9GAMM|nr:alpha/beta hydrolase [Pseudoxanthomonas sacheonensis]MDR6840005.1 pimeloyl-ACP methyl ester carboxylesterase [Pseudoxanthomonas sacheonensis]